jgi:uncharacterized protein YeeX (DUF496 family)
MKMARQMMRTKQKETVQVEVGTLTHKESQTADRLLNKAIECAENLDKNYLILAAALYRLQKDELYRKQWRYENFKDFVDENIPNCGHRKALYLIDIFKFTRNHEISKGDLKEVGWSKLKEIVPILKDGAPFGEWIQNAKKMSKTQLQDTVREYRRKDPVQRESARQFLPVRIEKTDREIITQILQYIVDDEVLETRDKGRILRMIVQDWYEASVNPPQLKNARKS